MASGRRRIRSYASGHRSSSRVDRRSSLSKTSHGNAGGAGPRFWQGRNADWVPREQWYDSEAQEWFIKRARELEVESKAPSPLLLGRHLLEMGLEPGPRIGEITRAVYEMQLDGRVCSLAEAKEAARG